MPQTDDVAEPFEELVNSYFPQDEEGLQQVLIVKGDVPLNEVASMDSTLARKKADGSNGGIYAWSIDDMVDSRVTRKFVQVGTKPGRGVGHYRVPFITRREDGFQRGRNTKKLDVYVETDKGKIAEERARILGSVGNRMAYLVSGSYDNPPNGTVDYRHMFGKGINRSINRRGTIKIPKKIHGAKSYDAFAAELDKKYDKFVSRVRKFYGSADKRDIALKLVGANASRVGLKQYVELADIVKDDLDLTRKVRDWAYFIRPRSYVWESTLIDIQDHLKKTVPRGTEAYVTLYEFGKATESYKMGSGFSFGNEDLPKDINGRMEVRFRQGQSYFGVSFQLKQNPLAESDIRVGLTLKDKGYSLTIKPI